MTRTVVALYDNFQDANAAVRELVDNGFTRDDISLMAGDQSGEYGRYLESDEYRNRDMNADVSDASSGAGVGASIGATLGGIGGLLVGLGALVIPGIGPVIAAGPLSAAIAGLAGAGAGALAGGITGGLIGALVDVGVPEETAQYYNEGVRRGGTLLTIRTDDNMSSRAVSIMNRHNPVDINTRVSQWRQEGWTGFQSETRSTDTMRDHHAHDDEMQHEHHHDREQIPTTGEDAGFNPGSRMDSPYAGTTGQQYSGQETSYGSDRGVNRDFDRQGGGSYDQGGGPSGHLDSTARGEGSYTSDVSGRDFNTTGGEMPTSNNAWSADTNMTGNTGTDYGRGEFRDFGYYDTAFHNHFNSMYGSTYQYDQYMPAYRYGYDLAVDPRYTGRSWMDVEPEAQRYWDEREPGAWERFKDAVRHAWNEVRETVD